MVELSSGFPGLGRKFVHIQRVSIGLRRAGAGLTSWPGSSSFLLLFLIWPVGSGTNTIKEKTNKTLVIFF